MQIRHIGCGMVLVLWTSMCAYSEIPEQATEQTNPADTMVESTNSESDFQYKQSNGKLTIIGVKRLGGSDVVIPLQIDGLPVTRIGAKAFWGCDKLTSITIPDSVTDVESWTFSFCDQLTSFKVSAENPNYRSVDGVLFSKDGKTLYRYPQDKSGTTYQIPDGLTHIGDWAFSSCSDLTSVTISNSVTTVGDAAFAKCYGLTSITVPRSVTTIGDAAFLGSDKLTIHAPFGSYAWRYVVLNSNGTQVCVALIVLVGVVVGVRWIFSVIKRRGMNDVKMT